jgi:short-subunit dehydrogenase
MTKIDRVVVTGASSGIGRDIAKSFLAAGSKVLLAGRNEHKSGFVTGSVLDVDGGYAHGR